MYRKTILIVVALFSLVIFAACATAAPQAAPESEAEAAPTEAPAEEAAPTEEPAEEAPDAAGDESAEESAPAEGEAATYTVDTEASTLAWYGEKPVGPSESGTVQIAEGALNFVGSELAEGSFTIDMTTIAPTSQSGNMLEMLTGHLKSDEFFGVETYPTATLVIKSAEPTDVDGQYAVVGDLTIKETTDEIEFVTDVVLGDGTLEATADIVVDRAVYDVQYGSGSFFSDLGDDLISDEMEMTVTLVASK